jgi:hypothetical protein
MAHPGALTAEQAAKITLAWASGAKYADACKAAGLTPDQTRSLRNDKDWMAAYEQARADFVSRSLQNIDSHGQRDWKATAWLLERIMPEKFGKRDTVQHEVKMKPLPWRSILNDQVIEIKDAVVSTPSEEPKGDSTQGD